MKLITIYINILLYVCLFYNYNIQKQLLPLYWAISIPGSLISNFYSKQMIKKHKLGKLKSYLPIFDIILHWIPFIYLLLLPQKLYTYSFILPFLIPMVLVLYNINIDNVKEEYPGVPEYIFKMYILMVLISF